jgi:hypothetical protein
MTDFVLTDPKQKVSDLTGIAKEQIGAATLQVDILKKEGLLINLDISGSSMFVCGTDWGELGVADDSTRAQRMTPGRKYLYPKAQVNRLNSVVSAMRQCLERLTYDLTGFRPSRYMHYKVYGTWKQEWAGLTLRFNEVKQSLIEIHDQAVDELADEFRTIAQEAWNSSVGGNNGEWIVFGGTAYSDFDAFTDAVVSKALSKMPTVDQIENGLHADYHVSMLYGLDDIAKQEAAAQAIREKAQIEIDKARSEKQAAYITEAAAQEQFNHEQHMLRLAEEEKELQIEAMMHAEAEHAREQLKQITSPFEEVMNSLRKQFATDAAEMLESIKKNSHVRGKVAERGKGLLEMYELLSIQDDVELRARLEQLKNAIGAVGEDRPKNAPERSTEEVTRALESIKELAHQAAVDLAAGPSRFSFVE